MDTTDGWNEIDDLTSTEDLDQTCSSNKNILEENCLDNSRQCSCGCTCLDSCKQEDNDLRAYLTLNSSEERLESKVLVLYTGGTIGMEDNELGVLAPSSKLLTEKIKENPLLHDRVYGLTKSNNTRILALPRVKDERRVLYWVREFTPLLDSSNMCQADWLKIANYIKMYYTCFDGFVILHGTDTLSYTASALSFMLENLGKPVIVTGSQISIFQVTSDGVHNFLGSLILAGNYDIPEVTVYFNNKLTRGNRTVKMSVNEFDAFESPNFPPLAKVGLRIDVNTKAIFRSTNINKLSVSSLNKNVGILRIYPDISNQSIKSFMQPPIEGVILLTYGSGNFPSKRSDLINELKLACDRGVIIVNCSQCSRGGTSHCYETGSVLKNIGVINGHDLTSEAALTKLSYILSKSDLSLEEKKSMMVANLRGELSAELVHYHESDLVSTVAKTLHISGIQEVNKLRKILHPAMLQSAVREGDIHQIKEMQLHGADLNMTDFDRRNILHTACSVGNIDVVRFCLENGVSVHARDNYNVSPLHEAVIADKHDIIILLRQCGAHLTNEIMFLGDVLTNAAARGMVKRLTSYILAGISLNLVDSKGLTPLHACIINQKTECVKFLLSQDVDIHVKNKLGQSPVDLANQSQIDEIKILLEDFQKKSI